LELDTGDRWVVESFFELFLEDYFAGVPECWLVVPEGNTKTTSLAGLGVYLNEYRHAAWIPWAASSRDQAEIGYRQAEGLILRSPRLRRLMKCQEGYRRIKNLETGGRIQIFAAGDDHADGIIPTDAFLDELHRHKDLRLYRTWRGKLEKRGGQMATISTAGEPGSEFELTRELIRQSVPEVSRRPGFVHCRSEQIALHEYAVDAKADVEDMRVVKEANPFSGITVESLARKRSTPTMTVPHWRRFVCNLATRGVDSAVTEAEWAAALSERRIPDDAPVWLGLDVAFKADTTAMVPLWMPDPDFRLLGEATILEPPRNGDGIKTSEIERALADLAGRYHVETVVMDPSYAMWLAEWIREELELTVIERVQSPKLQCLDYARFMEALRLGKLHHSGDPGLNVHVLNAVAYSSRDGSGTKFGRPSESRHRLESQRVRVIDALVAAAMVHSQMVAGLDETPREPPRVIDLASV